MIKDKLISESETFRSHIIDELLMHSLEKPVRDFFSTPGKNIRSRLVEIGYRLASPKEPLMLDRPLRENIKAASHIVEFIHAGSLIVDDIQDGSTLRRNGPSLHVQHGMPLALNAGNYLYFHGLSLIKDLELSDQHKSELIDDLLKLMIRAHRGQALDLGTSIDMIPQSEVFETCLTSMELKTGTLMTLALRLGSALQGNHSYKEMMELGKDLGLLLQMYDDFGNFYQRPEDRNEKTFEDLKLRRPTWIWAVASGFEEKTYQSFIAVCKELPDEGPLLSWINKIDFIQEISSRIQQYSSSTINKWENLFSKSHPVTIEILKDLLKKLETSYVKKIP